MASVKTQKQADHPRVEGAKRESEASKVGFGEYAADWLRCRIDLAERTEELYRWLLDRHIEPTFASSNLDEIEPPDVRAWYASAARIHPTTAAKAYRLLSSIMRTAVSDELITRNPCQVRGAAVEKAPERPVATIAEVEALTRAMPASLRIAVLLAAWCQLRRGEVRGLRRCDIDLERGTLSVSITKTTSMGGRTIVKEPKTRAGRRTVTIPPHVMEPLSRHLDGCVGHTPDAFVVEASNRSLSAAWDPLARWWDARISDSTTSGIPGLPGQRPPEPALPSSCEERVTPHNRRHCGTSMRPTTETELWLTPWHDWQTVEGPSRTELEVPGWDTRKVESGTRFGIMDGVDAAVLLQEARRRSGLSRRQLARRGGTSPSTLSAYESGASVPSVSTLSRLLRAAGFEVEANLRPMPTADEQQLAEKIEALFSFVDVLPRGQRGPLRYPVFGAAKAAGR